MTLFSSPQDQPSQPPHPHSPSSLSPMTSDISQILAANYVDDDAIRIFEQALNESASDENAVELITSVSDFAPIHERIKRTQKNKTSRHDVIRQGWGYSISRWPLLATIFFIIALEFLAYVWVRQIVNFMEWAWTWRGKSRRLRANLHSAPDYDSWKQAATEFDSFLGYEEWKKEPSYAYYDWRLVKRVNQNLLEMRQKGDVEGVRAILEVCLKNNFANLESSHLYSETYIGTKRLVEDYYDEVSQSIKFIREHPQIHHDEKAAFFYKTSNAVGNTALALSGGASFGYYHFGVVRALLDANLLPKIITGTSAGALVACLVCTRTDEELRRLLVPQLADVITACQEPFGVWAKRFLRTGARFDTVTWARGSSFFTLGAMTFKEAYERTGRSLNISVIPYDTHSPTKLLSHVTAPDCVIFSALIASAAVPGIINPVVLLRKDKHGNIKPWEYQGRHKDGSLRVDIPLQSLHVFFNVNYSIVSQVNPHIHVFAFAPRGAPGRPVSHRRGKGWRGGFFLSAAEGFLKLELFKNFRMIRDLELMPELYGQNWSAVFLQKFEGTVTIFPKSQIRDFFRLLTDPDPKELERMLDVGKRVTWPRIHMIENRMKVQRELDLGISEYAQIETNETLRIARSLERSRLDAHVFSESSRITTDDDTSAQEDAIYKSPQKLDRYKDQQRRFQSLHAPSSPDLSAEEPKSDDGHLGDKEQSVSQLKDINGSQFSERLTSLGRTPSKKAAALKRKQIIAKLGIDRTYPYGDGEDEYDDDEFRQHNRPSRQVRISSNHESSSTSARPHTVIGSSGITHNSNPDYSRRFTWSHLLGFGKKRSSKSLNEQPSLSSQQLHKDNNKNGNGNGNTHTTGKKVSPKSSSTNKRPLSNPGAFASSKLQHMLDKEDCPEASPTGGSTSVSRRSSLSKFGKHVLSAKKRHSVPNSEDINTNDLHVSNGNEDKDAQVSL